MSWYMYVIVGLFIWAVLSIPIGIFVGRRFSLRPTAEQSDFVDFVGFDPMMQFHRQLQIECPEGHAPKGELCDLPGIWICVERFKEIEVQIWIDEPCYDHEIGIDEYLPYDIEGTWVEVEIDNDCGYGCKVYEHNRTGRRVLAHNSAYGCTRSFNLIKE